MVWGAGSAAGKGEGEAALRRESRTTGSEERIA